MNLISASRTRLNNLGGYFYGKIFRNFSKKTQPKKTIKVPRSFYIKSSRYFNIIKKRVQYIILVARSIKIKSAILKNA